MNKIPKDMKEKNKFQNVFLDNPELKPIFFFGFYIVFFVFIVILLRSSFSQMNSKTGSRGNSGYGFDFNFKELDKRNYHFNYKVIKNGEVVVYDGSLNDNKQEFAKSGTPSIEYYSVDDKYYSKNVNTLLYEESTNPMEFLSLLDADILKRLFIHGSYISRTEYFDDSSYEYTYYISTSTILRNVDKVEADISGDVNKLMVKVNKEGGISEMTMDLTDYFKYFDESVTEYKLIISYSKFGQIGVIDVEV